MLKRLILVGAAILVSSATAASAQVQNCTACETAIKDKLTELDERTSKTNLLVKTVDRKLDPLVVKVDAIDTKLTAVQAKLDEIAGARSSKGAVVIEFESGVTPPSGLGSGDVIATKFCRTINYASGASLSEYSAPYNRTVTKLVCYM